MSYIKLVTESDMVVHRPDLAKLGVKELEYTNARAVKSYHDAVKFAIDNNASLQSVQEAAILYTASNGQLNNEHLLTRTSAIIFKDHGKNYVAFDDVPEYNDNLVLSQASSEFKDYCECHPVTLPLTNSRIKKVLARVEKTNRVLPLPRLGAIQYTPIGKDPKTLETDLEKSLNSIRDETGGFFGTIDIPHIPLSVKDTGGKSEFEKNDFIKALFGPIAELFAQTFFNCYNNLGIYEKEDDITFAIYSPLEENLTFGPDVAIIRTVDFKAHFVSFDTSNSGFCVDGTARGVVNKDSLSKMLSYQ